MGFDIRGLVLVFLIAGLVGCSNHPTQEQQLQSAQDAIVRDAMVLQRCEMANGYSSELCATQRKTYDQDLAVFKGTYGK